MSELKDSFYDRKEFNEWWFKLMNCDYACFYRDILRAEKETLWKRFKVVADEYHKENKDE